MLQTTPQAAFNMGDTDRIGLLFNDDLDLEMY
jgi:hypothetical protein